MERITRLSAMRCVMRVAHLALAHPRVLTIRSHLSLHERLVLYELARRCVADGAVCEIGSYLGASSCALAAGLRDARRGGRLVCVDTWHNEGMAEGLRDTWATFQANIAPYRSLLTAVRGRSQELGERASAEVGRPWSLVFFDGDHNAEGVRADWMAFRPRMAPGAIVSFHDIGWAEGVQRLVEDTVLRQLEWSERLPNLLWGRLR